MFGRWQERTPEFRRKASLYAVERRSRAGPLTKARILETALELIDEGGLDALSMRRLGASLGVDPMAVYHHVAGKQAILLGVVERIFADMDASDQGDRGENVSICGLARTGPSRGGIPTSCWVSWETARR
jgi:hypothetical protein